MLAPQDERHTTDTDPRLTRMQRGQSLVEMSFGFVILLFMISGLLDIGRLYFVHLAMEDGAGEAALYLSLFPDCRTASDGADCADPNNAEYRARMAGSGNLDWSSASITVERPSVYGVGDPVSVTIAYNFGLVTPIIPRIVGLNPITLTTEATQIIISE